MAERPVFIPVDEGNQLVNEKNISFPWHPGMAPSQKKKNISELHESAKKLGITSILEVSTKSEEKLGFLLSAFNLKVEMKDSSIIPLESAFQGSKCFQDSGPYNDLYGKTGSEIKKDERIKNSGDLSGFSFDGQEWELEPRTAFYDWLYIQAVYRQPNLGQNLENYNAFTDIEFNPRKSFNCQARSCALYVSLMKRQILENVLRDRRLFLEILGRDEFYQRYARLV